MIIKKIHLILILLISISFFFFFSSVWPELNLGIGVNYISTKFNGYNLENLSLSNYSGVNFSIPLQLGVGFNIYDYIWMSITGDMTFNIGAASHFLFGGLAELYFGRSTSFGLSFGGGYAVSSSYSYSVNSVLNDINYGQAGNGYIRFGASFIPINLLKLSFYADYFVPNSSEYSGWGVGFYVIFRGSAALGLANTMTDAFSQYY